MHIAPKRCRLKLVLILPTLLTNNTKQKKTKQNKTKQNKTKQKNIHNKKTTDSPGLLRNREYFHLFCVLHTIEKNKEYNLLTHTFIF